jgi:hypothetical protein
LIAEQFEEASPSTRARRQAREGRIFALTMAGGFFFLALVAHWRNAPRASVATLSIAILSLLAALFVPGRLETIRKAWMKLGEAIGFVTTPIIMAVFYYVLVTPIAWVRRATAKQPVETRSNWRQREPLPPRSRLERQF